MDISLREFEAWVMRPADAQGSSAVTAIWIDARDWRIAAVNAATVPRSERAVDWHTTPVAGEPLVLPPIVHALPRPPALAKGAAPLHCSATIVGATLACSDRVMGRVVDFLFDPRTWHLRYAIVDTRRWLPKRLVLLPMAWAIGIGGAPKQLCVKVCAEAVKTSQPHRHGAPLTADDAQAVQQHYAAWLDASARARARFVQEPLNARCA